ncbi:transcription termination factor 4, mitochondrial [Malaya genurostris]|uniref:transcription termination factor 4, mitochondrial n=1 Tax=Malaya genurostris TaxID=325434 RepID=UPI0026F3C02B|nr:transcription termination factor 4, mitochondrial [Malaya genurostris]
MIAILRRINGARSFCTQPLPQLIDSLASTVTGLDKPTLNKLFESSPELTRYGPAQWQRLHQFMKQEGIEMPHFLSIVAGNPELLARSTDQISNSMNCWRSCQFGDKHTQALLSAHPQLLDLTDHNQLAQRMTFLYSHFETRKNVWRLFLNCPNLVTDSSTTIQAKIDYFLQRMRVEVLEVVKSCAFAADLDKIRCRHVFLERLGLFKPRKLKADPGEPSDNPKLHQITDTTDKRFAVKVAYVTLEEFEVFQELFEKERNRAENRDDEFSKQEDESFDDDDRIDADSEARKLKYRKTPRRKHAKR